MLQRKNDRLVFDTNVIISLLLKEDFEFFVDLQYLHKSTLYTCPELLSELTYTLNEPRCKKYLKKPVNFYLSFINDFSRSVRIDRRFDRAPDIKDNYLFDLAYTVKSFFIVTGDKPLLNMKQVNKIKLISLAELKRTWATEM
jgi:putative PIN family toxin of toxin-antitoxin system